MDYCNICDNFIIYKEKHKKDALQVNNFDRLQREESRNCIRRYDKPK